jgi:3-hydroxy-9,10-secoandrosta-1,3,5(10)-triene-9,17-dione monooxygenase
MTLIASRTVESERAAAVVARTVAIIPELRARAERTALDRRVPQENVDAMVGAGSLKVWQAARNGGLELGSRTHLDVMAALGRGCGSTAWVAGVVMAHSWVISHMPERAQDEIYANPDTVVSAVIGPRGTAVLQPDGSYRLTGVWPFGSGCERSGWLLLGGMVVDEAGNVVDSGDFAVPTAEVTIRDDWFTMGLSGTGSCTMEVSDHAIPAHRFVSMPAIIEGHSPGWDLHGDGWVHRSAAVPLLAIALCGGAIGIARQALEDFPALVRGKTIAYTADDLVTHPISHLRVAEAAMRIHEGETILYRCADEIDDHARRGETMPFLLRARHRVDCAVGVRRCLEGVEILFRESGASGIRLSSPLCRALADLQAINQHGLLKLETNLEMYGRLLLGEAPNTPLV